MLDHALAKTTAREWAQKMLKSRAVILDFETTDIKDAEIVQVGVVDMDGNAVLETLVKPATRISPGAMAVHGITHDQVKDAPLFEGVYVTLSSALAGKIVIAYNADFEKMVLKSVCTRRKLPMPKLQEWECAMRTYANYYGKWNANRVSYTWQSLTNACIQQNVPMRNAHSALDDCLMTLDLIKIMASQE